VSDDAMAIDEFKLLSCIATGNFSQVWEVVEQERTEHLALKMLLPQALTDSDLMNQFKHEAKVCKSINHPSFCEFYKHSISKKKAYFVMEYFRAPNIKYLIMNDIFSIQARMNRFIEACCLGLGQMHEQGWVHKDIKPDNILFNASSELRIIDFSLSVKNKGALAKAFSGKVGNIQGTRTYIAPEVIRREHAVPQTDMYCLGVTLYEILTGQPPFRGSSPDELLRKHLKETPLPPSSLNANVSPDMDKFLTRMLAKKPANRFKDMNELLSDFRTVKVFVEDPMELKARKNAGTGVKSTDELKKRLDSRADAQRKREEDGAKPPESKPAATKPAPVPVAQTKPPEQRPAQPTQPPQQPSAQPSGAMPHQPMQPYPMHQMPGYGMPGQPQQGQPMMPQLPGGGYPLQQQPTGPGGYPQGQMYPGMPQPHQQQYPQQQYPQYPYPQQQPQPPVQQQQPQPQQPQPQRQPPTPPPVPGEPAQPSTPQQQKPAAAAQQQPLQEQAEQSKPKRQPPRPQGQVKEQHPSAQKVDDDSELPLMEDLPDIL